jgi:phosphonatase-like hydrolase
MYYDNTQNHYGLEVTVQEMGPWHGAQKIEVISHFVKDRSRTQETDLIPKVDNEFQRIASEAYFGPGKKNISLIHPNLLNYFDQLRANGVKVGLNTGYPRKIQDGLLDTLNFRPHIDAHVSAQDVALGRPSPYMVFRLMEKTLVQDVKKVAKVGDTVNDILEGKNAGCGLVIGVLSGADSKEELLRAGADFVVGNVTELALE